MLILISTPWPYIYCTYFHISAIIMHILTSSTLIASWYLDTQLLTFSLKDLTWSTVGLHTLPLLSIIPLLWPSSSPQSSWNYHCYWALAHDSSSVWRSLSSPSSSYFLFILSLTFILQTPCLLQGWLRSSCNTALNTPSLSLVLLSTIVITS